jgi:hypothetical protein
MGIRRRTGGGSISICSSSWDFHFGRERHASWMSWSAIHVAPAGALVIIADG